MSNYQTLETGRVAFDKLKELTDGIRSAMLTTVGPDGALHSRPMAPQDLDAEGALWFFTADDSGKVFEVNRETHVNVAYSDHSKDRYVSVSGRATLVRDQAKAKQLWTPWAKAYFPKGLEDPNLVLLRVQIDSAAYWEVKESKMVQLMKMAKAAMTDHQPNLGEHGLLSGIRK